MNPNNALCISLEKNTLQNNDNCIVITHHVPSYSLIDIKYKTQKMLPYNQCFFCDMDDLIEKYNSKIKCWVYGHTHKSSNVIINNIPFLCNPIGYPNENSNLEFHKNIIIDSFPKIVSLKRA